MPTWIVRDLAVAPHVGTGSEPGKGETFAMKGALSSLRWRRSFRR